MDTFPSHRHASEYVATIIDTPISPFREDLGDGVAVEAQTIELGNGRYTNQYDLSYDEASAAATVTAFDELTGVHDYASRVACKAATSGGFFFLADRASGRPRELALNLSASGGDLRSLPVKDAEAVYVENGRLSVRMVQALGEIAIGGQALTWAGSHTNHEADAIVYGNGNAVIRHINDPSTGKARVLDESSRFTPPLRDDHVDIGYRRASGEMFIPRTVSTSGGVDLFDHDVVLRMHERYTRGDKTLAVRTIGGLAIHTVLDGALSAGPMLDASSFPSHPINSDRSLGDAPPFVERPIGRNLIYKTTDGRIHLTVFDGRPGSPCFSGVTPSEAAAIVSQQYDVEWGAFTDSGQSAKLCVRQGNNVHSYGNRHYLRWPGPGESHFTWIPDQGRTMANVVSVK